MSERPAGTSALIFSSPPLLSNRPRADGPGRAGFCSRFPPAKSLQASSGGSHGSHQPFGLSPSLCLPRAWRSFSRAEGCHLRWFWMKGASERPHRWLLLQDLPAHQTSVPALHHEEERPTSGLQRPSPGSPDHLINDHDHSKSSLIRVKLLWRRLRSVPTLLHEIFHFIYN